MNIAIFSPNQNPYSETFIQAHKKYLKGNIFYYYGSGAYISIENQPPLASKLKRSLLKVYAKLFNKQNNYVFKTLIKNSLKKNKIDVLLIEYGTHAYHLLPVLKACSIPSIVHFHGYDSSCTAYVENGKYYSDVFKLASKLIVVSKVMENTLLSIGCPKEKLVYNVYGPRPEFFDVIPLFNKKQFVAVGRFTNKKAPYYTILAFIKVLEKHPEAQLLMAGDGNLLETCKNLVAYYKIEQNVKFLGVISPSDYMQLLTESLAFVQHSITAMNGDQEGTPLAILEAGIAGLPVISTYHAGIPDVIVHGETGLLCNEHDTDLMSKHMMHVLDNINLAKKMGNASKKHISANYNLEKHINTIQKLFKETTSIN